MMKNENIFLLYEKIAEPHKLMKFLSQGSQWFYKLMKN